MLKQKYCPDCKITPVAYVPGRTATKDYYYCSHCNEKFATSFKGFINRPVKPRKAFGSPHYLANRQAYDSFVR